MNHAIRPFIHRAAAAALLAAVGAGREARAQNLIRDPSFEAGSVFAPFHGVGVWTGTPPWFASIWSKPGPTWSNLRIGNAYFSPTPNGNIAVKLRPAFGTPGAGIRQTSMAPSPLLSPFYLLLFDAAGDATGPARFASVRADLRWGASGLKSTTFSNLRVTSGLLASDQNCTWRTEVTALSLTNTAPMTIDFVGLDNDGVMVDNSYLIQMDYNSDLPPFNQEVMGYAPVTSDGGSFGDLNYVKDLDGSPALLYSDSLSHTAGMFAAGYKDFTGPPNPVNVKINFWAKKPASVTGPVQFRVFMYDWVKQGWAGKGGAAFGGSCIGSIGDTTDGSLTASYVQYSVDAAKFCVYTPSGNFVNPSGVVLAKVVFTNVPATGMTRWPPPPPPPPPPPFSVQVDKIQFIVK